MSGPLQTLSWGKHDWRSHSLWCIPSNYFFLQLACQLQGLFLMKMAKPSELKWVKKKNFVVRMAQIGVGGGRKITKSTCFPFRKHTPNTPTDFFPCQLSVAGEKKIQEWAVRWRENRGSRFESCCVCLSHWVLAHSRWAPLWVEQSQRDWRNTPPSLMHYHTHPEEGSNSVLWAFRPWAVSLPQTLICEEKKMPTASVYRTVSKHS